MWLIDFIRTLFHWPDGIVVGNLIASAIWATPTVLHLRKKMNQNHEELKQKMREHHEAMKEHVKKEIANAREEPRTVNQETQSV